MFEEAGTTFDPDKYKADFERIIQSVVTNGNTVLVIRGHVDTLEMLKAFRDEAVKNNLLTVAGPANARKYTDKDGKPFDLANTKKVLEMIDKEKMDTASVLKDARGLSEQRARGVRAAIASLSEKLQLQLDANRLVVEGVGLREPVVPVPRSADDKAKNRRVEFKIFKVSPEKLGKKDFDL